MRTTSITKPLEVERKWYVVDAADKNLGRLSSQVAHILRGKHKPIFAPNVDVGDYVIIVNAEKIKVTGNKLDQKHYVRHSGFLGKRKETNLREMLVKNPEYVMMHAVKGMLPKNNLGRKMLTKVHIYAGPDHKHEAQKPEALVLAE
ncbi:MAG: 50S ribosomal protein L13 [Defluviitaleaceae bacterium]|nr:50S ribosomal protein L13 [Defluviitaleaceae bacterium]